MYEAGEKPGKGTYICMTCGEKVRPFKPCEMKSSPVVENREVNGLLCLPSELLHKLAELISDIALHVLDPESNRKCKAGAPFFPVPVNQIIMLKTGDYTV